MEGRYGYMGSTVAPRADSFSESFHGEAVVLEELLEFLRVTADPHPVVGLSVGSEVDISKTLVIHPVGSLARDPRCLPMMKLDDIVLVISIAEDPSLVVDSSDRHSELHCKN